MDYFLFILAADFCLVSTWPYMVWSVRFADMLFPWDKVPLPLCSFFSRMLLQNRSFFLLRKSVCEEKFIFQLFSVSLFDMAGFPISPLRVYALIWRGSQFVCRPYLSFAGIECAPQTYWYQNWPRFFPKKRRRNSPTKFAYIISRICRISTRCLFHTFGKGQANVFLHFLASYSPKNAFSSHYDTKKTSLRRKSNSASPSIDFPSYV